ncbi:hypothetical protein [Spirosoma sp. KUDC1026]|uniref:hypothetical protein n=1 Tax=Spirosoma sp. KUDC1026 TaxID=2745947 RepID=UPI00159BEC9D|nr:hypothetical protein [Spirosoma sp. KUDC1026]QKZ12798.1 hypothetical protein HU175_09205 [Spirosoma sp. KUDC1026]
MEGSSALTDGAQQANMVSNENAETKYGQDQGETNMVKLVDGKLTELGDTHDDVMDEQLQNRYSSDEERSLQGDQQRTKTYENSDAALRAGEVIDNQVMPENPHADAEITGNPDAGATVNAGLPSEDDKTPTSFFGASTTGGSLSTTIYPSADMIPPTPGTPDPLQPVPGIPETPPAPPAPGPEVPDLPGSPSPDQPEIEEPNQPDRSHEINAGANFVTYTSSILTQKVGESETVQGEPYDETLAGSDDQGMDVNPATGGSAHAYDVNAKDADPYQTSERPEEAKETEQYPREMLDESSVQAQDMISGPDRSDQKSTDDLDRKYNDPEAAREMAS